MNVIWKQSLIFEFYDWKIVLFNPVITNLAQKIQINLVWAFWGLMLFRIRFFCKIGNQYSFENGSIIFKIYSFSFRLIVLLSSFYYLKRDIFSIEYFFSFV